MFGVKGEGININTSAGNGGVMLIRLNQVEVSGITLSETVLSVQLELSIVQQVGTVVGVVTEHVSSGLENPDEFFARMVQCKFGFVVLSSD